MSKDDPHGDRMKAYEAEFDHYIDGEKSYIIRLDGRAFHTHTKTCQKPFDANLHERMVDVTVALCEEIAGARIGYTQSDEISIFVWKPRLNSQVWFGGRIQKMLSISAALASNIFNSRNKTFDVTRSLAEFDARIMQIPLSDVPNYFWWRQKDAIINSVSAMAQANFSHKELECKSTQDILQMLLNKGLDWEKCQNNQKYGTVVTKHEQLQPNPYSPNELVKRHSWNKTEFPKWVGNWEWFTQYLTAPV